MLLFTVRCSVNNNVTYHVGLVEACELVEPVTLCVCVCTCVRVCVPMSGKRPTIDTARDTSWCWVLCLFLKFKASLLLIWASVFHRRFCGSGSRVHPSPIGSLCPFSDRPQFWHLLTGGCFLPCAGKTHFCRDYYFDTWCECVLL